MSFALTHLIGFMVGGGAAAPAVQGSSATTNFTSTATISTNLPSGITSGEGLLLFIAMQDGREPSATGYTLLYNDGGGTGGGIALLYRTATGSEGSTVTVNLAFGSTTGGIVAVRVSPWISVIEAGAPLASNNPPSLTSSWGTGAATLWVAHIGYRYSTAPTITAAPAGYIDFTTTSNGRCAIATIATQAASENPGAFTATGGSSLQPSTNTVAIRGTIATDGVPYVISSAITDLTGGTHTITYPSNMAVGDLLLYFSAHDGDGRVGTTPSGWTFMATGTPGGFGDGSLYFRFVTGSEGATFSHNPSSSTDGGAIVYCIRGAVAAPEQTNNTSTADPPLLGPTWGASFTSLWLTFVANNNSNAPSAFTAPGGYGGMVNTVNLRAAGAWKQSLAASENPGAWAYTGGFTIHSIVFTVGVRGAY